VAHKNNLLGLGERTDPFAGLDLGGKLTEDGNLRGELGLVTRNPMTDVRDQER
jgi:hypothetical protein